MEFALAKRNTGMTIIAMLAVAHAAAGILRALRWFDMGSDLMGQGLLLVPFVGVLAFARGALVALLAALFVVFAFAAFLQRSWARPLGIVLAVANLLLVFSLMIQGESFARALPWVVVPAAILIYLLCGTDSAARRR